MWAVARVLALVVLAGMCLLLAGQGGWVLERVDRVAGLFAAGPAMPSAYGAPGPQVAVGGVAAGAVAALARPTGRVVGQLVTLLHELGHTVVAAALGARPAGIVLRHDASGHATARWVGGAGTLRSLALAAVAFAGLPAAAAVSAAGARLLSLTGPEAVLWAFAVAGAAVAALARSPWSVLVSVSLAGLAVGALHEAAQPWAAGVVVALLTATAVKSAADSLRVVGRRIQPGDDARVVARHVRLPAALVRLVQVGLAVALSAAAVWLLLPPPPDLPWPWADALAVLRS